MKYYFLVIIDYVQFIVYRFFSFRILRIVCELLLALFLVWFSLGIALNILDCFLNFPHFQGDRILKEIELNGHVERIMFSHKPDENEKCVSVGILLKNGLYMYFVEVDMDKNKKLIFNLYMSIENCRVNLVEYDAQKDAIKINRNGYPHLLDIGNNFQTAVEKSQELYEKALALPLLSEEEMKDMDGLKALLKESGKESILVRTDIPD